MGNHVEGMDMPIPVKITGMVVRDATTAKSGEILCGYFDARIAEIVDVRGWHLFFNGQVFRVTPPNKIDDNRHVKVASFAAGEVITREALRAYHSLGGFYGR